MTALSLCTDSLPDDPHLGLTHWRTLWIVATAPGSWFQLLQFTTIGRLQGGPPVACLAFRHSTKSQFRCRSLTGAPSIPRKQGRQPHCGRMSVSFLRGFPIVWWSSWALAQVWWSSWALAQVVQYGWQSKMSQPRSRRVGKLEKLIIRQALIKRSGLLTWVFFIVLVIVF